MNRKFVGIGASSIVLIVIAATAIIMLNQPAPQVEEIVQKPKFHAFSPRFTVERIYFSLQNLGNVSATAVNVTVTVFFNENMNPDWLVIDGIPVQSIRASIIISVVEAKEVNEFSILWTAQIGEANMRGEIVDYVEQFDFVINCAEGVTETFSLEI